MRRPATARERVLAWTTITVFSVLLLLPAAAQLSGVKQWPVHDIAALTTWPALPPDLRSAAKYPRDVSQYLNANFGLRGMMITANSLFRYRVGISSVKNVVIGSDGWLYYAYPFEQLLQQHTGVNVFTEAQLDRWVKVMEAAQEWMQQRGIAFYIVVAPDKPTIYPEHLPAYPPGPATRLEQITRRLHETKSPLEFVDPRAALTREKTTHLLYGKRDSHWLQRGAFIVYDELMARVRERFPNVPAEKIHDYESVTMPDPSDLAWHLNLVDLSSYIPAFPYKPLPPRRSLIGEEMVEGLARRGSNHIVGSEVVAPQAGASWGWHITYYKSDLADRPRLVLFADSFTDFVMGPTALYQTFRDIVYTHNNGGSLNYKLIEDVKPDIVIIVMAERYLQIPPEIPPDVARNMR